MHNQPRSFINFSNAYIWQHSGENIPILRQKRFEENEDKIAEPTFNSNLSPRYIYRQSGKITRAIGVEREKAKDWGVSDMQL